MHKLLNKLSTWAKGFFLKKEILRYEKKEMSQQRTICYLFCICVMNCSNEFLHHLFQIETYFQFFSVGMRKVWEWKYLPKRYTFLWFMKILCYLGVWISIGTQPRALLGSVTNIHFIWPNMAFIMKLILWDCVRFPIFTLTILNGNPCQNYLGTFQTYSLGRNHGYTYMCWIKLKRFTYKPKKFLTMQLPFWTF